MIESKAMIPCKRYMMLSEKKPRESKIFWSWLRAGDCRAVLCKMDPCVAGDHHVLQLSVEHDLNNKGELRRLKQLGVNTDLLVQLENIAGQTYTRVIGNYNSKLGYKNMKALR